MEIFITSGGLQATVPNRVLSLKGEISSNLIMIISLVKRLREILP